MGEPGAIARSAIEAAAAHLRAGEVVAVPTDTVYGLCVALEVTKTSAPLFARKERPDAVAVPVMVADLPGALDLCGKASSDALCVVGGAYWPGPLTLVVHRDPGYTVDLGGDPSTIGIRVPAHGGLRELSRLVGPLAVTSANLHGRSPCTTPAELGAVFGEGLFILDAGVCDGAVSSVIDLTGATPVVRREGPVTLAMVRSALDRGPSALRTADGAKC